MTNHSSKIGEEGLRERKRRETLKRITDAGMSLFLNKGYEATTLDDIAAAADISRRTFFYYFKSKDDILISMQSGMGETIANELNDIDPTTRPIDAMHIILAKMISHYPHDEMMAIDKVMRSSDVVQARKQANYIKHEETIFAALCKKWPDDEIKTTLRLIAMHTIGVVRISLDTMYKEGGKRPLSEILDDIFGALKKEI